MEALRRPTDRTCERCGRREEWDADVESWQLVREDGEAVPGDVFCLHEWDINGSFSPVEDRRP